MVGTALKPRQKAFVTAMASSNSIQEAAKKASVTVRTGYNYLANPTIKSAIRELQRRKMFEMTSRLNYASDIALNVLLGIMNDVKNNAQIRSQAAMFIIKASQQAFEDDDLAMRIERLEQQEERKEKYLSVKGSLKM
ncbi:MAG: hypothetical protein ABF490_00370 [Lentilactobacillus hilgardii]|uniref:hypothetical protein n=2 Tax=Lentilactobacillus hilgardii TaxID=1588 RepID=UPI0039E9EEE4